MTSAIGSSPGFTPVGFGKPTGGLEARLAQYETKLSDWVHCASCKTPEGKAKIAEITDKINEIKQLQKAAEADKQNLRPTLDAGASANDSFAGRSGAVLGTGFVGRRLDAFA